MTTERFLKLLENQPIAAESPVFDSEAFPRIDFVNKDLVEAALGAYVLTARYFDAEWNEVSVATASGRYGVLVEIRFANGTSDNREVTLFKTAGRYDSVRNPCQFLVEFPAAFELSKTAITSAQWNINALTNQIMHGEVFAILTAIVHDIDHDPERWRGFNFWHIQESWWTGLKEKLGLTQDYPYLITLPKGYDNKSEQPWPLLVFLHGTYECGSDLGKLRSQGPEGYITSGQSLPFIVLSPLCPKRSSWNPATLMRLIEKIETDYQVDPRRIYVTGLSMGGFSTFDLAAIYPEKFAAIAPLSAGENPEIADRIKHVPTWIFHGAEDRIVSSRQSSDVADRLYKLGAEVKLSVYPDVGHEGWEKIYANPELYEWFLRHSRPGDHAPTEA